MYYLYFMSFSLLCNVYVNALGVLYVCFACIAMWLVFLLRDSSFSILTVIEADVVPQEGTGEVHGHLDSFSC